MAERVFNVNLDHLDRAIRELAYYRDVELPNMVRELVESLTRIGLNEANAHIARSEYGYMVTVSTDINYTRTGTNAMIVFTAPINYPKDGGEPFSIMLAIEFGAGFKYNPTTNPLSDVHGYGPGTYPGKGHWNDPRGWWFRNDDNEWEHTWGNEATMPVYNAEMRIQQSIEQEVRRIFR